MERAQVMEALQPLLDLRVLDARESPHTRITVRPEGGLALRVGRGSYRECSDEGTGAILSLAGVPATLAKRLTPATLERAATESLRRAGDCQVILKDGTVVDIAPGLQRRALPTERVLETVERAIPGAEFHRVHLLPRQTVALETIGAEERAVAPGDLVRAGAQVIFSPVGTTYPSVEAFVLRLVCRNGATARDVMESFSYGEGDNPWQFFRQSVRRAYGTLGRVVARWQELSEEAIPPEDRAAVLESMLRHARLGGRDAEAVRNLALRFPPDTAYAALNLLTYASSHLIADPVRVLRARGVAADYAYERTHSRICPVCHRGPESD